MTAPEAESIRVPAAARRRPEWRGQAPIVAVVAVGGALGACARYGLALALPTPPGSFPWATFWTNVIGCAVIGVFMVLITDVWAAHRLVRPFFGAGVLGGFTTFSTYAVDIRGLVEAGRPGAGLAYLAGTLCAALTAVWLGLVAARRLLLGRQR
ncbi:fluoride efflux transporter CrcB [Streptomyces monashensis]|uniref:Fluoride-specific ion channel FluC n=1 Tax=Streptomyces monashensis TaxID=1678012 RepID=A0A1S2PJY5_9ACTN|nr:fluoride efflux transporter CrcB [Streptomyces monashensis]OIJ94081.1 chromosome condensation protein CrcB [Streptomyces monashensis]